MQKKMTPKEAFYALAQHMFLGNVRHNGGRPGELVNRLHPEIREALKDLKSSDLQDRVDTIFGV